MTKVLFVLPDQGGRQRIIKAKELSYVPTVEMKPIFNSRVSISFCIKQIFARADDDIVEVQLHPVDDTLFLALLGADEGWVKEENFKFPTSTLDRLRSQE
jgi:hypothetical protein